MKLMVNFELPTEFLNTLSREGKAGSTMTEIMEELEPEAAYFYAPNGRRGGTMILSIDDASQIPAILEPFYLRLEAKCECHLVMSPEELSRAGLEELGKRWG